MSFSLDRCPAQLIECIVELLDLPDIRSLRLSCRDLAAKSSQYRFRTYFRSKHIDLTGDAVREFAKAVQAGGLQSLVQDLYLTGIANEDRVSRRFLYFAPPQNTLNPLIQAFDDLAKLSKDGSLASLTLRATVVRDNARLLPRDARSASWWSSGPSRILWHCTVLTFETTLRALAASKLRIKRLNIFNDPDMQQCSLACEQLSEIDWSDPRLVRALAALESLSLSISDRAIRFDRHENEYCDYDAYRCDSALLAKIRAKFEDERNFAGLAKLLGQCPQLEDFELHYLEIYHEVPINLPKMMILQNVIKLDTLPALKRCRLAGISTNGAELLEFLKLARPRELSLETVRLHELHELHRDIMRPILDYCTGKAAGISRLHFDYIKVLGDDDESVVEFHGHGAEKSYEDAGICQTLVREGDRVRYPLACSLHRLTKLDNEYSSYQLREYGSPY
ncbi:hypothetical protein FZEAL_6176 [Fusarium zealandicum]|uniref:F-box domain-containing protein n=1 Tax=Fusarium zealandicum TaxID=1053134 RepID=A0A8H4UIT9_9HYPO|nr:hypothetical protein FZEAL_6176 [Fusarium zealandicum]